ncbi:unnamed protein product [Strongylus vulgaris]|uniref:SAP domain-containing protein n=1 Tax=Strongylus vulgaris TaxID=40348 RepID=A0A3P7IRN8_STRVU|nr:unnamed protein product [Strongylus vulgaris]
MRIGGVFGLGCNKFKNMIALTEFIYAFAYYFIHASVPFHIPVSLLKIHQLFPDFGQTYHTKQMSVDDPLVNGVPLSSLRVVDLKDELDKRGLSKIGNKSVLIERLKEVCN